MRLKDMPEGTIDMLGPGIPEEYSNGLGSKVFALSAALGVVAGYYYGITHLDQTQDFMQTAHDVVTGWLGNDVS